MSYAYAGGLQARVYQRLIDDPALSALVGGAVYDAPLEPALAAAGPDYVTLGEETVRPNGTKTSRGAIHDFTVTVHSGPRRVRGGEGDRGGGLRLPDRRAAGARGRAAGRRCASCAPAPSGGGRRRSGG